MELVDRACPAAAGSAARPWNAADAPPIDVAMRQGSSTWDLGEPPLVARPHDARRHHVGDRWLAAPGAHGTDTTSGGFWEGTDEWTPPQDR